jgi:YggT family protein
VANLDGFWIYQAPNLMLAALMYTLIGRFLLSLLFPPESDKVIWRVFAQITNPVVNAVALVTPQIVPERILVLFAVVWILVLRVLMFFALRSYGLVPPVAGS